jgi:predicted transposase/invertase (TIGR01784 family)
MRDPRVVRELLIDLLPKEVLQEIDLTQLEYQPGSYINDIRTESVADTLYKTKFKEGMGYVYLIVDHQNKPDKLMPFRLLKYICNIIDQHLKKHRSKKIPLVLPLVIYHGAPVWRYSTDINDLVDAPRSLVDAYFLKPFILVDLNQIEDNDLKKHVWSGSMLLTLKHIFKRDMLRHIYVIIELLREIELKLTGQDLVDAVLLYILDCGELDKKAFIDLVKKELSSDTGEKLMTVSEQFRAEGREEGKMEVAKHLLAEKTDLRFIERVTGLSLARIQELQDEVNVI